MNAFGEGLVTIILAVITVALVSVLVSKKANTSGVLQAGFSGIANSLGVAESPVTGQGYSLSLGYPGGSDFSSSFGG